MTSLAPTEIRNAVQLALDLGWGWASAPAEIIDAVVGELPDQPGVVQIADAIQEYMRQANRRLSKKAARQYHVKSLALLEEFAARQAVLNRTRTL